MNINTKISALIITKNEAHNIVELIENLTFVDEIVIVDSFSTDDNCRTWDRNYNSKNCQGYFQIEKSKKPTS